MTTEGPRAPALRFGDPRVQALTGALVTEALDRGLEVTCLTRGREDIPDGARSVVGDRTKPDGYDGVTSTHWDLVLDTTWQPGMARGAVENLAGRGPRRVGEGGGVHRAACARGTRAGCATTG